MTISATTQGIKPGVCTSTNRPSAPFDGQVIYMTDVDQTAVWDGTTWTVLAPIAGGRNRAINGAMSVWQRGTSFTVSGGAYTSDRFFVDNGTVTRQTGTGQFPYCLRIANSSGNPAVRHAIELPAAGIAGLFTVGSTWTVSFWARTSTTVTSNLGFYAAFCDTNLTNNNQIVLDTALPVPTTSWARYSKTFTIGVSPLGANLAMSIVPFLNSGSYAGNFEITGIQLEAGAVATPFEFEDYGTTLQKCKRYYWRNAIYAGGGVGGGGTIPIVSIQFPVTMRAVPTFGYISNGPTMNGLADETITGLWVGLPSRDTTTDGTELLFTKTGAAWTSGQGVTVKNVVIEARAEL